MIITNKLDLPYGLVKAASTDRHNAHGCLSATTLIQGIKQIILTDRYWEELTDDVSERIWAILGKAVHSLLESEGEYDFTEQEMYYMVEGIKITGTIDNYDMKNGIIYDYKTASVNKIKFNTFTDWYIQGMIYAYLLAMNKFPVNKCIFIALLKDHSKTEQLRDSQYPEIPVYKYEFPVTPQALFRIGLFIKEKVAEYKRCVSLKDDAIPPCTPEERWDKPPKFAVMKKGLKRAVRLCDSEKEANLLTNAKGEGHFVEFRKGVSTKCQFYCLCRNYCNFYNDNIKPIKPVRLEKAAEKLAA